MSNLAKTTAVAAIDRALAQRIFESVPVNELVFTKLLGLLEIRQSTAIPSACVTLGERSTMLLNPEFLARHCRSDEALAMLVLHELMHILLGHTRLFERVTPAQNIAFDAIINAQLCQQHPGAAWTALFRHIYRDDQLPFALLRPPEGWGTPRVNWKLGNKALRLHQALYSDTSVTYREIFDLLSRSNVCLGDSDRVPLIGNHQSAAGDPPPFVTDAIADIVARWPMLDTSDGRDAGGELDSRQLGRANPRGAAIAILRRALTGLADISHGALGVPIIQTENCPAIVPLPTRGDRRAAVLGTLGVEPLLYQGESSAPRPVRGSRVRLYLDVSGSMADFLPVIYAALAPLIAYLHPVVHLFSTEIHDIGLEALRRGQVESTGGTGVAALTRHLLDNRVSRALFVTDGLVGLVPEEHRDQLARRNTRVDVVLVADGKADFAERLYGRVYRLPKL